LIEDRGRFGIVFQKVKGDKMDVKYCANCGKETGHKRAIGWGTFFAVVLTGGLWLLAIPFYPKRCIICGV
jgi:hypothetical protein